MARVRVVGTAAGCVLAAFGAAFLIARATAHQGTATAATSTLSKPPVTTTDAALAAQFVPGLTALRQPAHERRHAAIHRVRHHNSSQPATPTVTNSSPSTTTATQAQQTTTTVSSPPASPPPTFTQPASPTSGSSGTGSGTTSVGGSGHKHHGTTKVGG
jgi:hypothetical protein